MTSNEAPSGPAADDVVQLIQAGRDREAARAGARITAAGRAHRHQPDGGSMDPLDQLDQLVPVLAGVVGGIGPDQLDRPTPCAQFDVRGVLDHMIGGAAAFTEAYGGAPAGTSSGDGPLEAFGPALQALGAAITAPGAMDRTIETPFGAMPGDEFARFVVLDGLVHAWDLATATGQPIDPPAELVAAVESFARTTLDPLRDGDTFGAAVEPPAGAPPIARLAALTGRHP